MTRAPLFEGLPAHWLQSLGPCAASLRDYQRRQIDQLSTALAAGHRRILVQLPTGGGKTHEIATIAEAAVRAGLRVLILATRTRLVRQIHERLAQFRITHGVIAASLPKLMFFTAPVQVASVDTLHRRAVVDGRMPMPFGDVVIFDEAHLATAASRIEILDRYPNALRIGFTATPARKSGRGLGRAFESLILGPSIRELQLAGALVPLRIYSTPVVTAAELKSIPRDSANDYSADSLAALLSQPKLVGDVVSNWLRIASGKRTLVFAVNKAHGAALTEDFLRAGVCAELLTDNDDEATREAAIERLEDGSTSVLVNVFLLAYGVDVPAVECIVLARPTRSLAMYLQMVGRGMRPTAGKERCLVVDHGRVVETLGLPQTDFPWSLKSRANVNTAALKTQRGAAKRESARTCAECAATWLTSEDGHACPACGWKPAQRLRAVVATDADLEEVDEQEHRKLPSDPESAEFFRQALGWYTGRWPDRWKAKPNSARWWAWEKARERFGFTDERPPAEFWKMQPAPPAPAVAGWLKSRLIRWAKSKARAA